MRAELSSLDVKFLIEELKILIGGRIQKIYQKGKELRIEVHIPNHGTKEIYFGAGKLFLTEYKRKAEKVEHFAMVARKKMAGEKIKDIRQRGFDRIVEIETENNTLILELFSKGNAVLCNKDHIIIVPLEAQNWKDRKIKPKEPYKYPPEVSDPYSLSKNDIKKLLSSSKKQIVKLLAVDLSFSGLYAEEICLRAGIDKTKKSEELSENEIKKIIEEIGALTELHNPQIILENGKKIDVTPFKLKQYESKESMEFQGFSKALDEYFTGMEKKEIDTKERAKNEKIEKILKDQIESIKKWERIEAESKEKANLIYKNFDLVQNIIDTLNKAREEGMEWKEIKERVKNETSPEASAIVDIMEGDGVVVLDLD